MFDWLEAPLLLLPDQFNLFLLQIVTVSFYADCELECLAQRISLVQVLECVKDLELLISVVIGGTHFKLYAVCDCVVVETDPFWRASPARAAPFRDVKSVKLHINGLAHRHSECFTSKKRHLVELIEDIWWLIL